MLLIALFNETVEKKLTVANFYKKIFHEKCSDKPLNPTSFQLSNSD